MKNKRNKGSAMILSILLLAFFMALSMNMFYVTQKKAQRAGYKVKGQTSFSGIDESSTLGYYELYLAGELVNIGSLYTDEHRNNLDEPNYFTDPEDYTTDSGIVYSGTSGTAIASAGTYAGIALSNYTEYFNSAWNIDTTSPGSFNTTTDQAIVYLNSTSGSSLISRSWEKQENKTYRLWQDDIFDADYISVGGYNLQKFELTSPAAVLVSDEESEGAKTITITSGQAIVAEAEYIKRMALGEVSYIILVKESIEFTAIDDIGVVNNVKSGDLSRGKIDITSEQLTEIIVEKGE